MHIEGCKLVAGDYTANVLRKQWLKLLKRVSFGVIGDGTMLCFHDLRHIFAQALLDEGLSLEDIQFLLGHESITTTQERYAMFARPDLISKVSRMDNVVKLNRKAG
jgi:site-specific recombinase XerD